MSSSKDIETLMHEDRVIEVPQAFADKAIISTQEYEKLYEKSVTEPADFWLDMAKTHLKWIKEPTESFAYDWESIGEKVGRYTEFFSDGVINVSENCLDRHLDKNANKTAILWQGESKEESKTYSYKELHDAVNAFAAGLKKIGIDKGDTVTVYLPMVPELLIAVLACARIGAIHSVVFSAFSSDALASRINDCEAKALISSDLSFHNGKKIDLADKATAAIEQCSSIEHCVLLQRDASSTLPNDSRAVWWSDVNLDGAFCEPEAMNAEDPLFILYTSGSTGKPKGVLHTSAGYLLYATLTSKYVFDLKEDDVFWCTADVGWITGHSYLTYGPLSNAATCVMFEGTPTYPDAGRFWQLVEQYKVSVFYTAPTAIRALMRLGDDFPNSYDLSSLRLLGTVGEPINPEAWLWYYKVIGKENCPVVDTWWQTETGGIMITTLPGAHSMKPGSAGKPFFGIQPKILKSDGSEAAVGEGGGLHIAHPWPGMLRGVYQDEKNELIKKVYFTGDSNMYFSSDGVRRDKDGYYWLLGRVDDVINVSAHRLATAEIESALVAHSSVSEAAVVGFPHDVKGQGIYCYVSLQSGIEPSEELAKELVQQVRTEISPIATPDKIHFSNALPKTRSGKIMRRVLRKIASGEADQLGDVSTLADPSVVETLLKEKPY